MSSSEADEEMLAEAQRLQETRRRKLAKQMAQREAEEQSEQSEETDEKDAVQSSSEESDSSDEDRKKLGDALFDGADDQERIKPKELNMLDSHVQRQIIESDSPELIGLLSEFRESLDQAQNKI